MGSVTVTPEEHDELEKLDEHTRAAAMRRLTEAGDAFGALTGESRRELMQAAVDAASEEVKDQIANAETAGMELMTPAGSFRLGGHEMRPLSLGVLAILQRIDHPIMSGDSDLSFDDLCTMLYVLVGDDLGAIVQASFAGGEAMRSTATIWAMGIDMADMRGMEAALQPMLDAAMNWGAEDDDDDGADPTKPVQSGS